MYSVKMPLANLDKVDLLKRGDASSYQKPAYSSRFELVVSRMQ